MANETLPLGQLVDQPEQADLPTFTPGRPTDRKQQYAQFMAQNPHLSHIPFETWDAESQRMQAEGAARMAATQEQMRRESTQGVGPIGAQIMNPAAGPGATVEQGLRDVAQVYNKPIESFIDFTKAPDVAGAAASPFGQLADIVTGNAPATGEAGKYEQLATQAGRGIPRAVAVGAVGGLPGILGDVAAQSLAGGGKLEDVAKDVALTYATGKLGQAGGALGEKFVGKQLTNAIIGGGTPEAQAANRELVRQAMTGTAPKVGQVAGQVAGATVGSVGGQLITGQDPTSDASIVQDVTNAAMFGMPSAARAMMNKSAPNRYASEALRDWWLEKQATNPGRPVSPANQAERLQTQKLLEQSASIPDNDLPKWKQSVVMEGLNDVRNSTTPEERAAHLDRLATSVVEGRGLSSVADASEQTAMMAYISPPRTMEELANLARRVNTLTEDAIRVLDERVAAGDPEAVSSTAFRQLRGQGYFTQKIDIDWLEREFGAGVEMSLVNSNATAYTLLTNKLAARLMALSQGAIKVRDRELTQKSVAAADVSRNSLEDKKIVQRFMDNISKIPAEYQQDAKTGESFLTKLYDRFVHHEDIDNKFDTGEGNKFMNEVSDLIENLTATRNPAEYPMIDWAGTKITQPKEIREADPTTGEEKRVKTFKDVTLGDYLQKDFEGKYTLKVTGRSSRSQKEILLSETGLAEQKPVEGRGQEAASEQELYGVPREKAAPIEQFPATQPETAQDWAQQADAVRGYLEQTSPDDLWKKVAPAFVSPGATTVHARTASRYKPVIKELVQSLYESGITGHKVTKESPAADELVKKLGLTVRPGFSAASTVQEMLRGSLKQSGRTFEQFRDELFKLVGEGAGVSGSLEAKVGTTKERSPSGVVLYGQSKSGRYTRPIMPLSLEQKQLLGASGGLGGEADAYAMTMRFLAQQGLNPEEYSHWVRSVMTTVNVINAGGEPIMPRSKFGSYLVTDPETGSRVPIAPGQQSTEQGLAIGGTVFRPETGRPYPVTAISTAHKYGTSEKVDLGLRAISEFFVHELVHNVQLAAKSTALDPTDGYTAEQKQAYRQMDQYARMAPPEMKYMLLQTLARMAYPPSVYEKNNETQRIIRAMVSYGSSPENPHYEFINVAAQFLMTGALSGNSMKMSPSDFLIDMPDEVAMFAKGMYRDLLLNFDTAVKVIQSPEYGHVVPEVGELPEDVSKALVANLEAVTKSIKKIVFSKDLQVAQASMQKLYSSLAFSRMEALRPPVVISQEPLTKGEMGDLDPVAKKTAEEVFQIMHGTLFPMPESAQPWAKDQWLTDYELAQGEPPAPPKYPKVKQGELPFPEEARKPTTAVQLGAITKTIMLNQQALDMMSRRGLPLAQNCISVINTLIPTERRMTLNMFSPFMTTAGKFDENNPAILLRQDRTAAGERDRALLNRLVKWAQENEALPYQQNPNGQWELTPEAQKSGLGSVIGGIPQRVVDSYVKLTDSMGVAANALMDSQMGSVSNRVARMIMSMQPAEMKPMPYEQASAAAEKLVRGLTLGNQRLATDGLELMLPHVRETVMSFMNGGVLKNLQTLQKHFQDRQSWFVTEQRPGPYLVKGVSEAGRTAVDGAANMQEVAKLRALYESRGYTEIETISKSEQAKYAKYDSPEGTLNRYVEAEQEAWQQFLESNPRGLTPDQIQVLKAYAPAIGQGVAQVLQKRSVGKFLAQRQSVPSVAGLDYVDNVLDYVPRLASTIARRQTRQQIELILADSRMNGQEPFANFIRNQVDASLYPTQKWERSAQAFTAGWYMAANLSSMIVNGMDAVNVLPETLISKGGDGYGPIDAGRHLTNGIANAVWANRKVNQPEIERTAKAVSAELAQAEFDKRAPRKFTPDEIRAFATYHAVELQQIDSGLLHDVFEQTDFKSLAARYFGTGGKPPSVVEFVSDPIYRGIRGMMMIPRMTHQFNNWTAYFAGLEQAIEAGKGPREAMQHADLIRTLALFTGGKTNAPTYMGEMTKGAGLSTVRVAHTMQQYSFGVVGRYIVNLSDTLSKDPNLTPTQRVQAGKALGTLLVTQLTMAGLLGLTGVAAALTIIREVFKVDAEAAVREGFAQLVGADKDNTGFRGLITEAAMNGAPNQFFGVNIGPRLGTASVFGFSPYNGFNLTDMAAGPSIVKNLYDGLGYLGAGDKPRAATSLAPNFLKRVVNMGANRLQFGDWQFRNPEGKAIYDPSIPEMLAYGAGFDPSKLSQAKKLDSMVSQSNKLYNDQRNREIHNAAVAQLQGNMGPTNDWVRKEVQMDPSILMRDPNGPAKVIADRASEMRQVQDPLASTPLGNSNEAKAIAQTFPAGTLQRRSEIDATISRIRQELGSGVLPTGKGPDIARAAMIDALTKQGLTKAQAEAQLRLMGF